MRPPSAFATKPTHSGSCNCSKACRNGPAQIAQYIHDLPLGSDSPADDLLKHFPALRQHRPRTSKNGGPSAWRASPLPDRTKSLSIEESDQKLTDALRFKIPTWNKTGKTTKGFHRRGIYKDFIKNPQAQPVISESNRQPPTKYLATHKPIRSSAHITGDYIMILTELQDRKAKPRSAIGWKEAAKYRGLVLKRIDQIADYLNWFEATQTANRQPHIRRLPPQHPGVLKRKSPSAPRTPPSPNTLNGIEVQMQ